VAGRIVAGNAEDHIDVMGSRIDRVFLANDEEEAIQVSWRALQLKVVSVL
jgi:hypothetical protein